MEAGDCWVKEIGLPGDIGTGNGESYQHSVLVMERIILLKRAPLDGIYQEVKKPTLNA